MQYMKKYKVVDLMEHKETIGYANTIDEIKKIAKGRYEDTDGYCSVFYYPLNKETNKYDFNKRKFLETF